MSVFWLITAVLCLLSFAGGTNFGIWIERKEQADIEALDPAPTPTALVIPECFHAWEKWQTQHRLNLDARRFVRVQARVCRDCGIEEVRNGQA